MDRANREPSLRSPARVILLVLALTMLGFGSSMIYTQQTAARLDDNAISVATNASPAIRHLVAARRELFRFQVAVSALEANVAPSPDAFEPALARFRDEMSAYRSFAFYAGEAEPYGDVERAIQVLELRLEKRAARADVTAAVTRVDEALERLIHFNAEQQYRLSMEIPGLRRRAAQIGYLLQGLTLVFGLLLVALVVRTARKHAEAVAAQKVLAEQRAADLEAFDAKLRSIIESTTKIGGGIASAEGVEATFRTIAAEARAIVDADYSAVESEVDPDRPFGDIGIGPFLSVPLAYANEPVGNLYLARRRGRPEFTGDDERAARLLAVYVGVAVHNAGLYREAYAATRAREDLLAVVSHDLKNPLNAILMGAGLLQTPAGADKTKALAARIERAAGRMARLIGDLLDSAKMEAGLFETRARPEEVTSLVGEAVDSFSVAAGEKGIRLSARVEREHQAVLCERDLALRVFSNLIGNALKFTPAGGAIEIAADPIGSEVDFSVKDSGPGISSEYLPHLFDRYSQQKSADRRGSGLGLFIAKGIVEAHGGRIWADSSLGHGTTIHFTLRTSGGDVSAASG